MINHFPSFLDFVPRVGAETNEETTATFLSLTFETKAGYTSCDIDKSLLTSSKVRLGAQAFTETPNENGAYVDLEVSYEDGTSIALRLYQDLEEDDKKISIDKPISRARIRVRHSSSADATNFPKIVTITNPYLYIGDEEPPEPTEKKLVIHKINKENLPEHTTDADTHIYYAKDALGNIEQYISTENNNIKSVNSGLLDYPDSQWCDKHLADRMNTIKTLQKGNTISFLIVTDTHVDVDELPGFKYDGLRRFNRYRDAVRISKSIKIDYILDLGDILTHTVRFDGEINPALALARKIYNEAECPVFFTKGNHDYNQLPHSTVEFSEEEYDPTQIMTNRRWFDNITSSIKIPAHCKIVYDENCADRSFYYIDDYKTKHRIIMLSSFETYENENGDIAMSDSTPTQPAYASGVCRSKEQIEFLVNKALDMSEKKKWTVSIFSHSLPYKSDYLGDYSNENLDFITIINAFQDGVSFDIPSYSYYYADENAKLQSSGIAIAKDFSAQGPQKVVGHFTGHAHIDAMLPKTGINWNGVEYPGCGINMISNVCSCGNQKTSRPGPIPPERTETGELAMSLNLFIVNTTTNTVNMIKLGAKSDNSIITSSDNSFTY
ncbi:metallophosphoesterase [Massilibacteroides sp.]|uniref:metallophosphoesterase family protein n=1 Tax=Massilibacteroides sp. TaxID=2034766 RepID=UPI002625AC13|nr:metallophosphoesterase [Massilibacteroides sp.]MDD4516335.1 metallophosphoesterase [Massilibacteroides sp.]